MKLDIPTLRCSSQVALLGAVTPNIRAVTVTFDSTYIKVFFYYDLAPTEEEEELAEEVASGIISDYTEYMIETKKITMPYPQKVPEKPDDIFIYHRYEI